MTKISALTASASLEGDEVFPAVQDGQTVKVTASGIVTLTSTMTVADKSADYTLTAADLFGLLRFTGSGAQALTVPAGVMTVGSQVSVLRAGTGAVTIAAGAGLTLNYESDQAASLRAQHAIASLVCVAADTVLLVGGLSDA